MLKTEFSAEPALATCAEVQARVITDYVTFPISHSSKFTIQPLLGETAVARFTLLSIVFDVISFTC